MGWQRTNRNSLAQFMRSRTRYVWVSRAFTFDKEGRLFWSRGSTYRRST